MLTEQEEQQLRDLLVRTEIFDLVRWERFCRDQKNWEGLQACFVPGSPVRTTWFDGTIEDFVEGSRVKMAAGSTAKHWIFPVYLRVNGDRALSEAPAMIFDRRNADGVEYDFFQYCRFFSRVQKTDKGWRLASFEGIYQRDHFVPVDDRKPLPIDWDLINSLRPSYRHLGYTQVVQGYEVNPELIGDDRPDLVEKFYAEEEDWLNGKG